MKTYEVHVNANALRTMKVRAEDSGQALDKAMARVKDFSGPWTIDFPGSDDEHYSVWLGDRFMGPGSDGTMSDEERETGDDE